jgi:hypothetical protein
LLCFPDRAWLPLWMAALRNAALESQGQCQCTHLSGDESITKCRNVVMLYIYIYFLDNGQCPTWISTLSRSLCACLLCDAVWTAEFVFSKMRNSCCGIKISHRRYFVVCCIAWTEEEEDIGERVKSNKALS